MELTSSQLVARRWLQGLDKTDERSRQLLTFAALVNHPLDAIEERLHDLIPYFDQDMIADFLSHASVQEAIDILSVSLYICITPDRFHTLYLDLNQRCEDAEQRAILLWIAAIHLDINVGAFELPKEYAEQLMKSDGFYNRVRGFAAYRHTSASATEIVDSITRILEIDSYDDHWLGLSGTIRVIEVRGVPALQSAHKVSLKALREVLIRLSERYSDQHERCSVSRSALNIVHLIFGEV